jgi:hypothetical protein
MSEATSSIPAAKPHPKLAAVGIDSGDLLLLRELFGQRTVETVAVPLDGFAQRLNSQKFEAVALKLDGHAEDLLKTLRASPLNKHTVIYGVIDQLDKAQAFFKYGLNALLTTPMNREEAQEVVAATHRLLSGELRLYPRVALVLPVDIVCEGKREHAICTELSAGGMSLRADAAASVGQKVDLFFALPGGKQVALSSIASWKLPGKIGVRFEKTDNREIVRNWLYDYLEIV